MSGEGIRRAAACQKRLKPPTADKRCGEYAGALAHRRRGEYTCPDCAEAYRRYHLAWRVRTGRLENLSLPVPLVADLLRGSSPEMRAQVGEMLGFDLLENLAA